MDADAAWDILQAADKGRDLDDFRTVSGGTLITCA